MTLQLAGSFMFQQRQILLPVVSMLSNDFAVPSPASTSFSPWVAYSATMPAAGCAVFLDSLQEQLDGGTSDWTSWLGASDIQVCNQCRHFCCRTWLCSLHTALEHVWISIWLWLICSFNSVSSSVGTGLVAMCRTGCLVLLLYLCRLLFFGMRLKGGIYNCDNVLQMARSSTAAVPWHFGIGLLAYSPRLCDHGVRQRRKGSSVPRYSADLYILLLFVAVFIAPATAANSRVPSGQPPEPTEFPRPPLHPDPLPDRGLLRDPDIAQEPDPPPWVLNPPLEAHITRAYKLFAFGLQPEFYSSTTRLTTPAQRCLELIEPDVAASRTGGKGALHFLRGPAVLDELQAQWMPDWVHSSLGRLVIIDPSLLGLTPFQVYIQDGIASYQRINKIMDELEGQEYYIFVPSQEADPLAFEGYQSRLILDHGDVVHLTPDPAPPNFVQDIQWAFDHFSEWSLAEFADGFDEPPGNARILVLSSNENFLFETVDGETDDELTQRICNEFGLRFEGASIVRPSVPFVRPMYCQHLLADIVCFLEAPLADTEIVVFVDARPVLQSFSAVRLRRPEIPVGEAIELFRIRVEAIEGYRLWLKGGKKRGDFLVAEHRETFWLRLEAQEFEYTSDDGSSDSGDSSDEDSAGDGPDNEPVHDDTSCADSAATLVATETVAGSGAGRLQSELSGLSCVDSSEAPDPVCANWKLQPSQPYIKWNRASFHDVFAQDRCGDTSDRTAAFSSHRFSTIEGSDESELSGLSCVDSSEAPGPVCANWKWQPSQPCIKWNRALFHDVFAQDRCGDTSDHTAAVSSHRFSTVEVSDELRDPPARKRSVPLSGRLWLFVATLFGQFKALQATFVCDSVAISSHGDLCLSTPFTAFSYGKDGDLQRDPDVCISSSGCLQIGPLVTLLEEARDDGFDTVCQFVSDVLGAFFDVRAVRQQPVRLSLETAIPCTAFQAAVQELHDILPVRRIVHLHSWQDWLDCDLHAVYDACRACPAIWDWLVRFRSWYDRPFDPEAVHIYTDGSTRHADPGQSAIASWAFNVWALNGSTQAYLGHAHGVTVPESSHFHLGETGEDALTGEQLALAWALCWTIEASCAFRHAAFIFHFDNQSAGFGGFGSFKLPTEEHTSRPTRLSHSVAVLRHCAQAVCTVIGKHVPSHSGYAGNELADVLAKFASRHPEPEELISRPYWPSMVTKHELSSWAWLALSNQQDLPALGAFEAEAGRLFKEAASRPFTFFASHVGRGSECDSSPESIGIQLRLCSLNVLSLREYDDLPQGLAVVGKRALLKQQFLRRQLHIIALQETRTLGDCLQPDSDYVMLHSSCTKQGCFGCAIWLSKNLPVVVAKNHVHYFTKDVCTVLVSEPRSLIAQVDMPGFSITIVSAHAPYDGHHSQCAASFWRDVGNVVSLRPSGAQLIVLADSNAHLGSISSQAVGTAGAETENQSGAAFHAFLIEFGLFVPSTFDEIHRGQHLTWKIGSVSGHRLDYVAIPDTWIVGELVSSVWTDFDHLHDVDDHQPVMLFCELARHQPLQRVKDKVQAPRPRADTDPGQLQCFDFAVGVLPPVDWHVDVDTHYAAFVKSTLW